MHRPPSVCTLGPVPQHPNDTGQASTKWYTTKWFGHRQRTEYCLPRLDSHPECTGEPNLGADMHVHTFSNNRSWIHPPRALATTLRSRTD